VLGTSLFCVGLAAASGAAEQWRTGHVRPRVAMITGIAASAALAVTSSLVTTTSWYDRDAFQIVFGTFLIAVALQMIFGRGRPGGDEDDLPERATTGRVAAGGAAAGGLAAVAGVGGGVILVPLYHSLFHLRTREAVGTSTAAIMLIAASGAVTYALLGWGKPVPWGSIGYVDLLSGVVLAVPAMITARLGVLAARRLPARGIRIAFGVVAVIVATRLLTVALG
jgi:uncharacterized membrane protein YfcA